MNRAVVEHVVFVKPPPAATRQVRIHCQWLTHGPEDVHPDRCCPRWMVCCEATRFGCCDPGWLKAMKSGSKPRAVKSSSAKPHLSDPNAKIYAMFTEVSTLQALVLDSTGKTLSKNEVTGESSLSYGVLNLSRLQQLGRDDPCLSFRSSSQGLL